MGAIKKVLASESVGRLKRIAIQYAFKHPKSTAAGVASLAVTAAPYVGIEISVALQVKLYGAILFVLGLLSTDAGKSADTEAAASPASNAGAGEASETTAAK